MRKKVRGACRYLREEIDWDGLQYFNRSTANRPFCEVVECWSEKVEHRLGNEEVSLGNVEHDCLKVEVDG